MPDPVINFGKVAVSIGYNSAATSIALTSGEAARVGLPDPASAGAFNGSWWNSTDYADPADDPNREVIRVTARSGDTLTVVRGQEGSTASNKNTAGKSYKMGFGITKKVIEDLYGRDEGHIGFGASSSSPVDGQTVHFANYGVAPQTGWTDSHNIYIHRACLVTAVILQTSHVSGSGEDWPFYLRVNDTTDHLLFTQSGATRQLAATGLSIALAAGDLVQVKAINPTWATNPTNFRPNGRIIVIPLQ